VRAACEACGALQPPDWKPGEQCVACGRAVRRDVRCFWCAKRTPFARFCRSCGAELVDETRYGAARMLKDAGTDRFTIPRMLRELEADQVENFTRIYQRHAAAATRHVDEVRFLERFLFQKSFSAALEDDLVPQLPWPEETLEHLSGPPLPPGDDRETVRTIAETTPFGSTRQLAALARVRLDDWKALDEAQAVLHSGDPELRAEAALAVSGWRVRSATGRLRREEPLIEELRRSPFRLPAAVRLGLLGRGDPELLREALASPDRETSFAAALVLGDVDRLRAGLEGDDLEKAAAGSKLISLGVIRVVEEPIRKSPLEVQQELVESLVRRQEPAPEVAGTLLEIVETTEDERLRERAARVLCRRLDPSIALRIARAARGDRHIFQSLLSEEAALPPETLSPVADFLLENGAFTMSQYGLKEAGERGAIPDGFVPSRFERADGKARLELLRLAEAQLEARKDEELHRFVMNVVFGPYDAPTRAAAWWCLHRWYRSLGEHRGEGPLRLERPAIERFFGSPEAFAPKLAALLRDPASLKEVGLYEFLAHLFRTSDGTVADADLVRAALEAVRGDYWPSLVEALIEFLGEAGQDPRWRGEVVTGLEALGKKGNYAWEKALRRLRLSAHGLPDEPEWRKLPPGFVPERFTAADEAGRRALLRVAEEQLIHGKHPELLRFLLRTALGPDEAVRDEAFRIWEERGGREFRLGRTAVEAAAGPFGEFLDRTAAALEEARLGDFVSELLNHPAEAAVRETAAEGEGADRFVRALLATASREEWARNLRMRAIQWAGKLGADPRWKAEAVKGLRPLAAEHPAARNALRELDPPSAPPAPTVPVVPRAPELQAYAAKAKEAERLGKELQEAALRISFGPGSPEEKAREVMRLQAEFQERIRMLYGA